MRFLFNLSVLSIVLMIFISCGDEKKKDRVSDECELMHRTIENLQKLVKIVQYNSYLSWGATKTLLDEDKKKADDIIDELESIWFYAFDNFSDKQLIAPYFIFDGDGYDDVNYCMNEADIDYFDDLLDFIGDHSYYFPRLESLYNEIDRRFYEMFYINHDDDYRQEDYDDRKEDVYYDEY